MKIAILSEAAAETIPSGAAVMIGGFMGIGPPQRLIDAMVSAGRVSVEAILSATAARLIVPAAIAEMRFVRPAA